jgi:hypothetical protein
MLKWFVLRKSTDPLNHYINLSNPNNSEFSLGLTQQNFAPLLTLFEEISIVLFYTKHINTVCVQH